MHDISKSSPPAPAKSPQKVCKKEAQIGSRLVSDCPDMCVCIFVAQLEKEGQSVRLM